MAELPTHDLTEEEFFFTETIVKANAEAETDGGLGMTQVANGLLNRLLAMARKPHDEGRAMRFLAVQTEAFHKCQTERDQCRKAVEAVVAHKPPLYCEASHSDADDDEEIYCPAQRAIDVAQKAKETA